MLKDCDWSIDRDYKTGSENEPLQFYMDGLANSNEFNLLLGYFSSSAINLLSVGFATFISKGGKMKMVINHILSEKDKEALWRVEDNPNDIKVFDLTDVVSLGRALDEYDTHFFECLAYLISVNRIDIKVIKPKNGKGIAHYKSGVLSDGQDAVGYQASCNFTYYGLAENIEQLEAFLSWENGRSNKLIKRQLKIIDDYFTEKDEDVEYVPVKEIEVVLINRFGKKEIEELLVQEEQLLKKKQSLISNPKLKKTITKLFSEIDFIRRTPRFPYSDGPREYQINAYNSWVANNYKGLFAMATGTGKTITSLNCLLQEYLVTGFYNALILVPTMSLVEQWEKECLKFNFSENIVKVYSANNWKSKLAKLETLKLLNSNFSFIIIATYASFLTKTFQNQFKQLPTNTLLIADEAHNMGSPNILKKLKPIHLIKRIGLSATPERQFQEEINNIIREFFGEKGNADYTFSYTMEDAIKKEPKALCPYRYYPKIVKLTKSEFNEYVNYTRRLVAMHPKNEDEKEIFNRLCIARQRIIHKAENKINIFISILHEEYKKRGNLKYTLIYVPEGLADEDSIFDVSKTDILRETESDRNLLNLYTRTINKEINGITVRQFIGDTNSEERKTILKNFANGDLQVITSMKCLDEGIDVPRSELAIFCASTGNPRQFIQRRGRILRLCKDKDEAVIYDLIVIPDPSGDVALFNTERNEVEKELRRVRDFAEMSENKHYTRQILHEILLYYNLTL
ncbi:MAG: DNA repair helicase [Bacteroidetes bacterium HGW-Bacteroidetes-19]|nr:MAG: DNA repair helicase [Bacteroidetes bacterium HGW-Bacteroidetes-19]